jgi:hypothetical protein
VRIFYNAVVVAFLILSLSFYVHGSFSIMTESSEGWNIDLFCRHGGVGKNATSGDILVGERIKLFAYATYNEMPVQSVLVAFQVNDPSGSSVIVNTGQTNASGYAEIEFRITPDVYPIFPSLWESFATMSPTQQTVMDAMPFSIVYSPVRVGGSSVAVSVPLFNAYVKALFIQIMLASTLIAAVKFRKAAKRHSAIS